MRAMVFVLHQQHITIVVTEAFLVHELVLES